MGTGGEGAIVTGELEMPVPMRAREYCAGLAAGHTWRTPFGRRHAREHQATPQRAHTGKLVPGVRQVAQRTRLLQRRERRSRDARVGGVGSRANELTGRGVA